MHFNESARNTPGRPRRGQICADNLAIVYLEVRSAEHNARRQAQEAEGDGGAGRGGSCLAHCRAPRGGASAGQLGQLGDDRIARFEPISIGVRDEYADKWRIVVPGGAAQQDQ